MTSKFRITDLTVAQAAAETDIYESEQLIGGTPKSRKQTLPAHRTALNGAPNFQSTFWYFATEVAITGTGSVLAAGTLYLVPYRLRQPVTISQLGISVTTLKAAGNVELCIYDQDPSNPSRPKNLIADVQGLVTDAVAFVSGNIIGGNKTLRPGLYFFGCIADATAAGTAVVQGSSASDIQAMREFGHSSTLLNIRPGVNFTSQAYAALPADITVGNPPSAGSSPGNCPVGGFKVA